MTGIKISDLIRGLEEALEKHGDLEVAGRLVRRGEEYEDWTKGKLVVEAWWGRDVLVMS